MTRGLKDDIVLLKKIERKVEEHQKQKKEIINLCYKDTYGHN